MMVAEREYAGSSRKSRRTSFGLLIEAIKNEYKTRYIQIYRMLGISRHLMYRYMSGELIPPISLLEDIKKFFNIDDEPLSTLYNEVMIVAVKNKITKIEKKPGSKMTGIGHVIYEIRINNLLNQVEMGKLLNMTGPNLLLLESGKVRIDSELIAIMCARLKVTEQQRLALLEDIENQWKNKMKKISEKYPERILTFAEIFTRTRLRSGHIQSIFSSNLFIIPSYYTSLESGRLMPSLETLKLFLKNKDLDERDTEILKFFIKYCDGNISGIKDLVFKICDHKDFNKSKMERRIFRNRKYFPAKCNDLSTITVSTFIKILKACDITIDECLELLNN